MPAVGQACQAIVETSGGSSLLPTRASLPVRKSTSAICFTWPYSLWALPLSASQRAQRVLRSAPSLSEALLLREPFSRSAAVAWSLLVALWAYAPSLLFIFTLLSQSCWGLCFFSCYFSGEWNSPLFRSFMSSILIESVWMNQKRSRRTRPLRTGPFVATSANQVGYLAVFLHLFVSFFFQLCALFV